MTETAGGTVEIGAGVVTGSAGGTGGETGGRVTAPVLRRRGAGEGSEVGGVRAVYIIYFYVVPHFSL